MADGLGDTGKKFREESLFEFAALRVVPMMLGLFPFGAKVVGQRDQMVLCSTHGEASPPLLAGDSIGAAEFVADEPGGASSA